MHAFGCSDADELICADLPEVCSDSFGALIDSIKETKLNEIQLLFAPQNWAENTNNIPGQVQSGGDKKSRTEGQRSNQRAYHQTGKYLICVHIFPSIVLRRIYCTSVVALIIITGTHFLLHPSSWVHLPVCPPWHGIASTGEWTAKAATETNEAWVI